MKSGNTTGNQESKNCAGDRRESKSGPFDEVIKRLKLIITDIKNHDDDSKMEESDAVIINSENCPGDLRESESDPLEEAIKRLELSVGLIHYDNGSKMKGSGASIVKSEEPCSSSLPETEDYSSPPPPEDIMVEVTSSIEDQLFHRLMRMHLKTLNPSQTRCELLPRHDQEAA